MKTLIITLVLLIFAAGISYAQETGSITPSTNINKTTGVTMTKKITHEYLSSCNAAVINFTILQNEKVNLMVFNSAGEKVVQLLDNEPLAQGTYQVVLSNSEYNLPTGDYTYMLITKSYNGVGKLYLSR